MSDDHKTKKLVEGKSLSQYVKLNVGGTLFYTTIGTLTKSDNMLRAMFSGKMEVLIDSEDWVLIDRCGKHFGTILNYLRDGAVALPESSREISELLAEAKYFLIQELIDSCQQALAERDELKKQQDEPPCSRVHLLSSEEENQKIIKSTSKLVVELQISEDYCLHISNIESYKNLLRNMVLFKNLSLKFSGKLLFIKNVRMSLVPLAWNFYCNGKQWQINCCFMGAVTYLESQVYNTILTHALEVGAAGKPK